MNKHEMACYETDASRLAGVVEKVLFPETISDVQKIVKNSKNDIVPRGAGTELEGGAIPENSIVVDIGKMNKVTNFVSNRKTVRVEAGITLKELNEKLYYLGFEFPVDSFKKQICTIGGMIAVNSSGDRSMRYGNIRDWIEEIEFVNGKGELAKTSRADLTDVCGMEGISGIIVAATLKLSPIIKRSASAFQTENLDEILSIARKLKSEKEVVLLEMFSPFVSKLIGLPEKYNLIIEFNSDRGKIKGKDYEEIAILRESVFSKLAAEGYYNVEDPKLFFDKIKEFIVFLEENKVPYIGHLGSGIIHPFFKDMSEGKRERVIDFIKKIKASPGRFGIGLLRKYFIDSFQAKLIQRVKLRHDPRLKFNKNKVIDIDKSHYRRAKISDETVIKGKVKEIKAIGDENLVGENMSAAEVISEMEECKVGEKDVTPEEKMKDFIKRVEIEEKMEEIIAEREEISSKLEIEEKKASDFKPVDIEDIGSVQDNGIREKVKDYEDTFKSELSEEKRQEVEKIARDIPRDFVKNEKIDYRQIQDIMTGKKGFGTSSSLSETEAEIKKEIKTEGGRVTMDDNLDRKSELSVEDKELVKKIMGNSYKSDENKDEGDKSGGDKNDN